MTESRDNICQSCSFPLEEEHKGTEVNGTSSEDYCEYCYKDGQFTEPNLTIEGMIDKVAAYTAENSKPKGMSLDEAKDYLQSLLPTLKRWEAVAAT